MLAYNCVCGLYLHMTHRRLRTDLSIPITFYILLINNSNEKKKPLKIVSNEIIYIFFGKVTEMG